MNETNKIVEFVHATRYEDLSPELIASFKVFVLDTFAAALIGSQLPWAKTVLELVHELGGREEASVINQSWKTDISRAALANGTMIASFECEPLTGSHASGTVFPAVFSVCEREHMDGKSFMTALILGAEVSARINRTAVGLESERGFHNAATQGPLGAAVAVGKLYEIDYDRLVSALGIAGSSSAGLLEFAWDGANTKRIHLGRASQLGLESALLARKGFSGPSKILEGRYGYFNAFSLPPNMAKLLDGLGQRWAVQPISAKSYPSHVTHQPIMQAIQLFRRDRELASDRITRIAISGDQHIMEERHSVRDPKSLMGAQYSLPFAAAVALMRDLSNPLNYDEGTLWDPQVRDLAKRIELIPVEGLHQPQITIEIAGEVHALAVGPAKGSMKNPFTWDDVCDKFRRYAGNVIAEPQVSALIKAVEKLNECKDIGDIAGLLRAG